MSIIEQLNVPELLLNLQSNSFIGSIPQLIDTSIRFEDHGNILYCEDGVILKKSRLVFKSNDALIVLRKSKHPLHLRVDVWNNCLFYLGANSYTNAEKALRVIASERRNVVIGDDSLMSFGIWIRTADPHLIYDCSNMKRINQSKDILIGDHVWIGQNALILKGTSVGSGSIIGANSVCSGKTIPSNTSWAGNPAKLIAKDVFFSKRSAHSFSLERSEHFETFRRKDYIFVPSTESENSFSGLQALLEKDMLLEQKLDALLAYFNNSTNRSRFMIPAESQKSA